MKYIRFKMKISMAEKVIAEYEKLPQRSALIDIYFTQMKALIKEKYKKFDMENENDAKERRI